MHGDFPAKITVRAPYIPINVWFWPTLHNHRLRLPLCRVCECACLSEFDSLEGVNSFGCPSAKHVRVLASVNLRVPCPQLSVAPLPCL
jgi:hypothetical protein